MQLYLSAFWLPWEFAEEQQIHRCAQTGTAQDRVQLSCSYINTCVLPRFVVIPQGYFRIYIEQIIPHTPRGFAYPYHFGAMRPTTQVGSYFLSSRSGCPLLWWIDRPGGRASSAVVVEAFDL